MVPIVDVMLHDLGPNRAAVLRVVAPLLRTGYAAVARSLRDGPLLIATDESLRVAALTDWLQEQGAVVTWDVRGATTGSADA